MLPGMITGRRIDGMVLTAIPGTVVVAYRIIAAACLRCRYYGSPRMMPDFNEPSDLTDSRALQRGMC